MKKRDVQIDVQKMLKRLGSAVKTARLAKAIRQRDITEETGLSQNIVTNLEVGNGSAVSSLLIVLNHLDLFNDLIDTIEDGADRFDRVRIKPTKMASVVVAASNLGSGASIEELTPDEDAVTELSDALRDEELPPTLAENPTRIYRINKNLVTRLAEDPVSNIAVYTNTVRYETPSGSIRQREVYYAATLEGANATDLTWTVGGFIRKPGAVIHAVINPNKVSNGMTKRAQRNLDGFLVTLRQAFSKFNVFVETVSFDSEDHNRESCLRKGDREILGEVYKGLYSRLLNDWLQREVQCQE